MARDFSKMKPEELEAIFQANFGQGKQAQPQVPSSNGFPMQISTYGQNNVPQGMAGRPNPGIQQPQAPATQSQVSIKELLKQLQPTAIQSVANAFSDYGGSFSGQKGTGTEQNDLSKLYAQEAIKKQFEDKDKIALDRQNIESQIESRKSISDARKQGDLLFGGYDANSEPIWITPPDNRKVKNMSPGLTNPYQERAVAEADLARQEADLARNAGMSFGQDNQNSQQGQPGLPGGANPNATPGTKLNVGPYSIPVNPELTETEARTFSAIPSIQKSVDQILRAVKSGVGNEGNIGQNAYSGIAIDTGFSPATFGQQDLQGLQSAMNQLKRDTLFTDAGKALTVGERQIVERLFNVSGKSPEQIAIDIPNGVQKFYDFVKAKQGGMYGYNPFQQNQHNQVSQPSAFDGKTDEELMAELQRLQGGQNA